MHNFIKIILSCLQWTHHRGPTPSPSFSAWETRPRAPVVITTSCHPISILFLIGIFFYSRQQYSQLIGYTSQLLWIELWPLPLLSTNLSQNSNPQCDYTGNRAYKEVIKWVHVCGALILQDLCSWKRHEELLTQESLPNPHLYKEVTWVHSKLVDTYKPREETLEGNLPCQIFDSPSLQNCEINFCCLNNPVCDTFLWQLEQTKMPNFRGSDMNVAFKRGWLSSKEGLFFFPLSPFSSVPDDSNSSHPLGLWKWKPFIENKGTEN